MRSSLIRRRLPLVGPELSDEIAFAPVFSDAAWGNAARQGIPILRSPDELLAYVRENGIPIGP